MKRHLWIVCLALPAMLLADVAQAGIFGRRWERRRAELYGQLSGQVQRQVAGASAHVEKKLTQSLDTKVAEQTAKLETHLEEQLADLRKQAADAVAAESKRLQDETAASLAKLREE